MTAKSIKALFFDLDGTLVDTHEANFAAYSDAIESVTGQKAPETLKQLIAEGRNSNDFLPLVVHGVSADEVKQINDLKKQTYLNHMTKTTLNDYLATLLKQMSQHMTTALVTTAKRENAQAVLVQHNLAEYFTFCIFGEDVSEMKPNPEAYTLALAKAGIEASEALAFEDSEKGMIAANAADIRVLPIKDFIL